MVDVTLTVERAGESGVVRLLGDTWELTVRASIADLVRLGGIRRARGPARRPMEVGTCAGSRVFWTSDGQRVTILVGPDHDAWDLAVVAPLSAIQEVASLAEDAQRWERPRVG
jgi:hypothetical protein